MNLPIPTTLGVRAASQIAGQITKRIGDVLEFANVLADSGTESDPNSVAEPPLTVSPTSDADQAVIREQLINAVRDLLAKSGINLNQPVELDVQSDGSLIVRTDHHRAAEIEARLQDDAQIRGLAESLHAKRADSGDSRLAPIRLTIPNSTATILPAAGGYPNW